MCVHHTPSVNPPFCSHRTLHLSTEPVPRAHPVRLRRHLACNQSLDTYLDCGRDLLDPYAISELILHKSPSMNGSLSDLCTEQNSASLAALLLAQNPSTTSPEAQCLKNHIRYLTAVSSLCASHKSHNRRTPYQRADQKYSAHRSGYRRAGL
uniref:Uncharacterized protein n=1 Tax=Candidatus Methanogaster sp. ANME-2c ERB4 TaxID=2759911 RepID=A0A7G9YJ14_9EURY|nr:hypothetical protein KNONPEEI_00037 [Methanosarcinales archaeon ANME-2c ERB4]QNO48181.1 hypothetical protein GOJLPIDM_00038 [Methanosarcinales archaeon ANME-2c ERB4]